MIHLQSVTKTYFPEDDPPKPVLLPTTIALPTDRRVAILGGHARGKSTLLRLLAGLEAPDDGTVFVPVSLSPIVNSRRLFHLRLTGAENVRLFARTIGVDADRLTSAVNSFCGMDSLLERPVSSLKGHQRQILEVALVAMSPFDCYLLDDAPTMPVELLERFFEAVAVHRAGIIFTTVAPRHVRQYADFAVLIRGHTMQAFTRLE